MSTVAFFSPIPRPIFDLCAQHGLLRADVAVLGVLLDHKNLHTSEVDPKQTTIAARLGVSLPTVERAVARLRAAKLITSRRVRDRLGRLGQCVYDLAAVLKLLPKRGPDHPSRMRDGGWGKPPDPPPPPEAPLPSEKDGRNRRQSQPIHPSTVRGQYEADSDVAEADNSGGGQTPSPAPPVDPVAAELILQGVFPRTASALVQRFGPERCRLALTALRTRGKVRDKAAWLVGCLMQGWTLRAGKAGGAANASPYADLPKSHQPYRPAW